MTSRWAPTPAPGGRAPRRQRWPALAQGALGSSADRSQEAVRAPLVRRPDTEEEPASFPAFQHLPVPWGQHLHPNPLSGLDAAEREGLSKMPPGLGAAALLPPERRPAWPAFAGRDLTSLCPGIRHVALAEDGATTASVLRLQLPRIPEEIEEPVLVTLTAGGNDLVGLLGVGRPGPPPRPGSGRGAGRGGARTLERVTADLRSRFPAATLLVGTVYDPSDGTGDLGDGVAARASRGARLLQPPRGSDRPRNAGDRRPHPRPLPRPRPHRARPGRPLVLAAPGDRARGPRGQRGPAAVAGGAGGVRGDGGQRAREAAFGKPEGPPLPQNARLPQNEGSGDLTSRRPPSTARSPTLALSCTYPIVRPSAACRNAGMRSTWRRGRAILATSGPTPDRGAIMNEADREAKAPAPAATRRASPLRSPCLRPRQREPVGHRLPPAGAPESDGP